MENEKSVNLKSESDTTHKLYVYACGCRRPDFVWNMRQNQKLCPEHHEPHIGFQITCLGGCGTVMELSTRSANREYCDKCGVIRNVLLNRERNRRVYEQKKAAWQAKRKSKKGVICPICGEPVEPHNITGKHYRHSVPADYDLGREEFFMNPGRKIRIYDQTISTKLSEWAVEIG